MAPLVDDEPPSGWARLAAACDFGNGISSVVSWSSHTFANADLTIAAAREPRGEWVGVSAVMRVAADGVAVAEGHVMDVGGYLGTSHQTVLVRER